MDAERFDTLARALTASGSRRRALAALSGGLALAIGATSPRETKAKKKKCPPCKKPKKGKCKGKKPDGTPCAGGTCQSGVCSGATVQPTCTGLAQSCSADAACCTGICNAGGSNVGPFPGTANECATCRTGGAGCAGAGDPTCCGARTCSYRSPGAPTPNQCCSVINETCSTTGGGSCCAEPVNPAGTVCADAGAPGAGTCCLRTGTRIGSCGSSEACCTGGCGIVYTATPEAFCCTPPGATCTPGAVVCCPPGLAPALGTCPSSGQCP
jgi:hypothetical protein